MPLLTLQETENLSPVFRGKFGHRLATDVMKLLSIDRINSLYDRNCGKTGPDFAEAILKDIGVEYTVSGGKVLDSLVEGPFITVSNHPYGSIDGIILADIFGHIRRDYKVIVNKFLSRIKALDENFICVTPTGNERGTPTKDSISGIKTAMFHVKEGHPLGIFPSGAVSDLSLRDGCIRDREWQEPILRLIMKLKVPVIPVTFLDGNSAFYYCLGLIDWRIRLLRLPSEVFNKKGHVQRVAIGEIIMPEDISGFKDCSGLGKYLREKVYGLKNCRKGHVGQQSENHPG